MYLDNNAFSKYNGGIRRGVVTSPANETNCCFATLQMDGMNMSNIREVASRAGVSPATVSRVMNNDTTYKITPHTRELVWQAVAALNYKLPTSARRTRRTGSDGSLYRVGCLLALTRGKYNDPYYMAFLSGAERYLLEHGCDLSLVRTEAELKRPDVLESLLKSKLDGLLLMHLIKEPMFSQIHESIPCLVGIEAGDMPIDSIEYDHRLVADMAVKHLYQRGCREIGFIGGGSPGKPMVNGRRYLGYREALRELNLPFRAEWAVNCGWNDERCTALVTQLAKTSSLPQAFFAASDHMAMAAMRGLHTAGIPVPGRVAIIGLNDIEMSKYSNPPLTTIHIPMEEMGMTAAAALIARMTGDATLSKRIILPCTLIERESV